MKRDDMLWNRKYLHNKLKDAEEGYLDSLRELRNDKPLMHKFINECLSKDFLDLADPFEPNFSLYPTSRNITCFMGLDFGAKQKMLKLLEKKGFEIYEVRNGKYIYTYCYRYYGEKKFTLELAFSTGHVKSTCRVNVLTYKQVPDEIEIICSEGAEEMESIKKRL